MSELEEVRRRRLLEDDGLLTRALQQFVQYTRLLEAASGSGAAGGDGDADGDADAEAEAAASVAFKTLGLLEADIERARVTFDVSQRQYAAFEEQQAATDRSIAEARMTIEELKQRLEDEKINRQRKTEYEAMAKVINTFDTQSRTRETIASVEAELHALEEEQMRLGNQESLRHKQLGLFFHALTQLKRNWDDMAGVELEEDEQMLDAGGGAGAEAAPEAATEAAAVVPMDVDE